MSIGPYCHVMAQVDAHDAAMGRAEQDEADIQARAAELYDDEYCPWAPDNMCEALGEVNHATAETLAELLRTDQYAEAGKLLESYIDDYWLDAARKVAEREQRYGHRHDPREDQ